jgi:predicted porin
MFSAAYVYHLSKRTSVGLSYASIRNDAAAFYNFDGSAGGQGSPSGAVAAGEDPRIIAATIRHAF